MSKIDKQLYQAKYGDNPVEYFKHLPGVVAVKTCHDEVEVHFKQALNEGERLT